VRLGSVTGFPGRKDLVVVEGQGNEQAYVRIYQPSQKKPYFQFRNPYLSMKLAHAAPDLEIVDINKDGIDDICKLDASHGDFPIVSHCRIN